MSDKKQDDSQKDPLLSNKIAGALLGALLLIFGLPQVAGALFGGGHHGGGHEELHLAYCCVELETTADPNAGEKVVDLGAMMSEASMTAGERGSGLCASCHTFNEGGPNGTGPNLWNIVGRPVGGVAGFNYSSALTEAGGNWTYERLDAYLENSQEYLPGTSMVQRIGRDEKRAELLVYLGSLSDNPITYPAPLQAAVEDASIEAGAEAATGDVQAEDTEEGSDN